jgi:hypothetical protein
MAEEGSAFAPMRHALAFVNIASVDRFRRLPVVLWRQVSPIAMAERYVAYLRAIPDEDVEVLALLLMLH